MYQTNNSVFKELANVGYVDSAARIAIGTFAMIATLLLVQGSLGVFALIPLLSVYPILTGIIAFDPFYHLANVRTTEIGAISDEAIRNLVSPTEVAKF